MFLNKLIKILKTYKQTNERINFILSEAPSVTFLKLILLIFIFVIQTK